MWLQADPDRVIQMLVNLLTNAARYSEPGGSITVGTELDNAAVTISCAIPVTGSPPADLERVFERFVQVGPHARVDWASGWRW